MIERLVQSLQALAAPADAQRARSPNSTARTHDLAADYADALRLVIDCPQIRLDPEQREALERVEDALERASGRARVADLARAALATLREERR